MLVQPVTELTVAWGKIAKTAPGRNHTPYRNIPWCRNTFADRDRSPHKKAAVCLPYSAMPGQ
jgi:hypothetical protein